MTSTVLGLIVVYYFATFAAVGVRVSDGNCGLDGRCCLSGSGLRALCGAGTCARFTAVPGGDACAADGCVGGGAIGECGEEAGEVAPQCGEKRRRPRNLARTTHL